MEQHNSWLTLLVNKYLGPYALALLDALHVHPHDRAVPIPEFVVMGWVVVLMGIMFVLWLKPRLSVDRPGATQTVVEMLLSNPLGFGIRDALDQNSGHHARKYLPLVGTISLFLLASNMLGIVPVFSTPTLHPSVPLACALITYLYFNYLGMKVHGVGGYLKHFAGPVWWIAWLIFPVELFSVTARILSLTMRLFANMFASELIYVKFLELLMAFSAYVAHKNVLVGGVLYLLPASLPVIFIALHMFVAVVQAYVFTVVPSIYIGLAVAEEH